MRDVNKQNLPQRYWIFPPAAKFGRVIPKEKIYTQAGANSELKQLFIEQVAQIKWAYKLAQSTINLAKTEQVHELEVIHIKLKAQSLDDKIVVAIDKAIPHPTLFMLTRTAKQGAKAEGENGANTANTTEQEIAYQAAHKLKSITQANKEKWQQSAYLKSGWLVPSRHLAAPLPAATNLENLYKQLLEALLPLGLQGEHHLKEPQVVYERTQPQQKKRSLEDKLTDLAAIATLNKKIKQTEAKRNKEKQFNRKRELNDEFKTLKKQLAALMAVKIVNH